VRHLAAQLQCLPAPIRLSLGAKPFDITDCLHKTKVKNMSIAQLLMVAPALRRILSDSLKGLPREQRVHLLNQHPALGIDMVEFHAFLAQAHVAKDSTHNFPLTVHGCPTRAFLDGGACVNVCSPSFLKRVGITKFDPVSSLSIQTIQGRAEVLGEVHNVPLCFANAVTVAVSCVIIDVPFDLLLGRGFLELMKGSTDWDRSAYWMSIEGYEIYIDATGKTPPVVMRKSNLSSAAPSPILKAKSNPKVPVSLPVETESSLDSDDEASSSEVDQGFYSTTTDSGMDDTSASDTESDAHIMFAQALQDSIERPMTDEEIRTELGAGSCLFWMSAVPISLDDQWKPAGSQTGPSIFLAEKTSPVPSAPLVTLVNTTYGFHLEAPRCRDILTDTPCIPVPGLEEHKVMVGDLPEVHKNMSRIQSLFEKHKGAFPLSGEMSRTMNPSMIGEPAHFHLKSDVVFPRARTRKYTLAEQREFAKYHDKMVAAGKMRKSSLPTSCNALLVVKKDGSYRVVVNYIPVNRLIAPCAWPIPDPMVEISKLQGCDWLSCWDCKDGYLQSPIAEACRFLTAVAFPDGLWEYNVLPMGLIDSMQWYTRHMYEVFNTEGLVGALAAYVDDMTNGTKEGFENHFRAVTHILERMDIANGSFAGAKSAFFVQQREFLGRIVGNSTVSIDPKKIEKARYWPLPMNVTELCQFVGFALFLGSHVDGFSDIAAPLFDLYKFDKKPKDFVNAWNKDPAYAAAFLALQSAIVSSPVLILINHQCPIILSADTSNKATGYVVAHAKNPSDDDNITTSTVYAPILFGSRKLSGAEQKMCATERELLGLVFGLCKNRHLLQGKKIHVFIDHRALLYLHNLQNKNQRLTAWSLEIAEYRIEIHHRPGKLMKDTDPLSRVPTLPSEAPPLWGLQDELDALDRLQDTLHVALATLTEEPYSSIGSYLTGKPLDYINNKKHAHIQRLS